MTAVVLGAAATAAVLATVEETPRIVEIIAGVREHRDNAAQPMPAGFIRALNILAEPFLRVFDQL